MDFGPYPLERLRRDPCIITAETGRPATPPKSITTGRSKFLVSAINQHLDAYDELHEPEPVAKEAPVPDDLSRRSTEIKGAGYFLDASQMGICEIPGSGWLDGAKGAGSYAVVILIEYSAPIDFSNIASGWVDGNAHLFATLRAAEIAACMSGQILSMGFVSKCHWTDASDVAIDPSSPIVVPIPWMATTLTEVLKAPAWACR